MEWLRRVPLPLLITVALAALLVLWLLLGPVVKPGS